VQLSAVARDAAGQPLPGRSFLWATADSTIASVTQTGLVTVRRAGQVAVSATAGGVYSVVHLDLYSTNGYAWPDTLALIPGGTRTMQARAVSLKREPMLLDSAKWESADPSVVRVDSITGAVTAVGAGRTLVTARLGTTRLSSVVFVKSYGQLRFTSVGVGSIHGCGLVADGTAYCWGSGMVSQLGTSEPTSRCEILNGDTHGYVYRGTYRCSPHPVPVGSGLRFTELSVGADRTCGVVSDGSVYCWGGGYAVTYDTGPPSSFVLSPVRVQSPVPLRGVRVKGSVACGLSASGAAYCWGSNSWGALGNGSTTDSEAAVPVSGGLTFTSVEVGGMHACGLTSDGAAYCWGRDESGQLGAAPPETCTNAYGVRAPCSTRPVRVSGDVRFSAIRGGDDFTCGLDGAGRAYCWGAGAQGRLGNGTVQASTVPVAVQGGLAFQSLSAGSAGRTCGLTADGSNYCWGTNVPGSGTPQYVNPAPVRALPSFALRSVDVGSSQDCGIAATGIAYCWSATSAPAPVPSQ
ncbi:MAG: Ig-like domain-containing protein, partial [Gemmatimonadetes bacterium]|nr:Ig-like domain-containing protein [Gemmatimonadota bacterium]